MATELGFSTTQKKDGKNVIIKDLTTGWGEDYDTSDVDTVTLSITSQYQTTPLTYVLKASGETPQQWTDFLSDDGVTLLAETLGFGEYFADAYYEFTMTLVTTIAITDTALVKDGFIAEHNTRAMLLAKQITWPHYKPDDERDKVIATAYLEAAKYSAANGEYDTFIYLINKVNKIYEHFNIEAIW